MLLLRIAGNKYGSDPSTDACGDVINKGATKETPISQFLTMVTTRASRNDTNHQNTEKPSQLCKVLLCSFTYNSVTLVKKHAKCTNRS